MLDRRTLLRAGSAAVGAAALAPPPPGAASGGAARPPRRRGLRPGRYRHDPAAHSRPLRAPSLTAKTRRRCSPRPSSSPARPRSSSGALPDLVGKLPCATPLVTQANLKLASPGLRLIEAGRRWRPVLPPSTPPVTRQATCRCISGLAEEMLVGGDVVVNPSVSFLHSEWPFGSTWTCHR
jgi:hypothetical protein